MIDCCQFTVFAPDPRSVLARDPVIRRDDLLRGYSAETDDNSGAQQISFISEIRHAAVFLVLSGTAVAGRMTLQDIGDVDFLSGKPCIFQQTVKHNVEAMTEYKVAKVDVYVVGVDFLNERAAD